jgi:hypothetical protein
MQTETLVGLISGLGGAVIGFAGALGGAWIQQSYGAKIAKQERLEQRSLASGETAINELLQLGQLVEASVMQSLPDDEWIGQAREHLRRAELAVSVIPNSVDLRYRMTRIFFAMHGLYDAGISKLYYNRGSREGVGVLAAFIRGDELPDEASWVETEYRKRVDQPLSRPPRT